MYQSICNRLFVSTTITSTSPILTKFRSIMSNCRQQSPKKSDKVSDSQSPPFKFGDGGGGGGSGSNKQPFTVFIEGNIGSGKTTFLNYFNKFDQVDLHTEPVDKWRSVSGANLLDLMYKDHHRWAFPFQTYVTVTMLETHVKPTTKSVKLMERSLFSTRYCFVENMYKNKVLEPAMYQILQEWYSFIDSNISVQADLIVYLRTSPKVVFERMKLRARSEEECVPFEYIQQLHELHEDWLIHGKHNRPAPVLVLDADLDLENIGTEYKRSEGSILKPILIENTNQQAVYVTPTKRQRHDF